MEIQKYIDTALAQGFNEVGPLDVTTLNFMPEVRDMCSADRCRSFNRSWSCPPACGELDEIAEKCRDFTHGILVVTVGKREDEFDFESIEETNAVHKKNFSALADTFSEMGVNQLPMGAGACTICAKCTYPDAPCRFPEKAHSSMEACGLFVSKVCKDNGVKYYYGPDTICFIGCFLFK